MFAALGRLCFRHRRLVLVAWVVVVAAGFTIGAGVFGRLGGGDGGGEAWESVQGFNRLAEEGPYGPRISALVDGAAVDAPRTRTAVSAAAAEVARMDGVGRVVDTYRTPLPALRATDGRAGLIAVDLTKQPVPGADARVEQRLRAIAAELPGSTVVIGGQRLLEDEINEQVQQDTERGELIALPLTLLVMVLIFGGFLAAGVPFLGAIASIAGGLLALLGWTHVLDETDPAVVSVCTVLGLGLSIDYALLMVSRYREERGNGYDADAAIERTMATAGRTITFSALTVATSLAGLFVFPLPIFQAIGAAGVSVVLVALLAGLTLAPALIAVFRRRIKAPTRPVPNDGPFARLARRMQRRPLLVTGGVAVVLLLSATPFLHVEFENGGANLLPKSFESRRFADTLQARFPGSGAEPVIVVADAPVAAARRYAATLTGRPGVGSVGAPEALGSMSRIEVTPSGASQGDAAQRLVRDLRDDDPGFRTWVTGDAAVLVDFKEDVARHIPAALGFVVVATFVLLFLMTGSVLVPVKALVMNTLSLGATFGALVWIFQDGHLAGLLGFDPPGALETWVPVIAFAFAFGLSMDYEVFLLSRIKEMYDAGVPNNRAVELGLQRSGRIITSAALLVVIVFSGFAAGKMLGIKQMGLALAVAVAVDATLVRCLLVPATMTLLGDRNWWAPRPLRRLHGRIGLRETVLPGAAIPPPRGDQAVVAAAGEPADT